MTIEEKAIAEISRDEVAFNRLKEVAADNSLTIREAYQEYGDPREWGKARNRPYSVTGSLDVTHHFSGGGKIGVNCQYWYSIGPLAIQWTDYDGENFYVIIPGWTPNGNILTYVKTEITSGPVVETIVMPSPHDIDQCVESCLNMMLTNILHKSRLEAILRAALRKFFQANYGE